MLRCTYLGFSHNLLSPLCFLFRTVTRKDTEHEVALAAGEAEGADDPLVYTPPPSPLPPPYSPPHHQRSPGQVTGLSGSDFLSQRHVLRLNGYKKRCPCKFSTRKRKV
ncbi:hypothetical protein Q7C36_023086 [Tachysurus vachellii]|uniref:Uncharacterized protein n=1 Tax=Tachysurus vachellii TaxID=175792 RepID=A0AA88II55_TACVA|nr:hypothetical protein Q7C36_023086 [Tachysurus vachellii]